MKTIAIIGAGTMGNGIAHTFAQYNYKVHLIDLSVDVLKEGIDKISTNLERMISKGTISDIVKERTLANIKTFTNLREGVGNVDLVIEAVSENKEIKLALFKQLDSYCNQHTILASNTSSISITELGQITNRAAKVIGMHFMNPVPLMKLVEVIKGSNTSPEVTKTIVELAFSLDKTPVEANDFPGFIANRIVMPMLNEAIEALQNGVAGVIEIDTVMKLGMAHPMGPLQLADFIGLDVCLSILNVLHDGFNNAKYIPCNLLVTMVESGNLGIKSGKGFYDYTTHKKAERVASQFL